VFVYGVSYGTYWANRYLQLQPAQAAGVILDSIVIPGASLARQDEDADAAGKLLFEACAKDAVCRTKLGDDPWGKAQAVFAEIAEGHCAAAFLPGLPPRVQLRRAFGQMMMGFDLRSYLPAAVHRLDRCTDDDAVAITKLLGLFFNEEDPGEFFRQYSFSLANNVALSELWETPSPTPAELAKIRNAAIVSRDITEGLAVHIGKWPTYPAEDLFGKLATTDLPLLMMQAPLDPATLYAKALPAKAHWTGPRQHWVEFANGGHSMLGSTPTTANKSCGTAVLLSFVRDPKATPDTSCLASLRPVSFEGTPELSKVVFGRDSAWD
jgi:pimeloyl-ACP methyl ester carboxylesterase